EHYKGRVGAVRAAIQEDIKEVRLSRRLTLSPSCLVLEEGDLSPQMEAMLRQAGQDVPVRKPILELNPDHEVLRKLQGIFDDNGTDPRIAEYAGLLYAQAVLAEGGQLADPSAFTSKLAELMLRALD
ncbi:MAG: molecular chaperone HtpG, partial [Deltaproteobacteria bacterium]|nr:molecular chaperone HtpG [Deltaproteobacteria bacterium]